MGWYSEDLTKSERALLTTIWKAKNKTAGYAALHASVGLTHRGLRTVLNRMSDRSLLAPVLNHGEMTITFKGMQVLGVTGKGGC